MRKCIECQKELIGRADKRYCDDYCRTSYHNRRYRNLQKELGEVNARLRQNRTILSRLYVDEMSLVSRNQLVEEGFDFRYNTSVENYEEYKCRYCYEYGLVTLGTSMCGVVMKAS